MRRLFLAALTALLLLPATVAPAMAAPKAPAFLPNLKREKPDMDKIRAEITDTRSAYYYPRLIEEFMRNDTLMKIDKYRRLYLGAMLQEDYSPYRSADHPLTADVLARANDANADSIIAYANKALADDPFDLQQMMLLINALRKKKQTNLAAIWQYKFNYLLMAIMSTGTGLDPDNAWVVIDPQHEYMLLNMLGYIVDDHRFIEPWFEYISVSDGKGRRRGGYYFDIHTLLQEYYRKNPEAFEEQLNEAEEADADNLPPEDLLDIDDAP